MTKKTITLETVARHAGVSMKTVSRVINNEPFVSDKTRQGVQKAIDHLKFKPNMAARQLRGQRSYSIALLYEPPGSEFLTGILDGVSPICRGASYKLVLEPLAANETFEHISTMIERRMADGFILLPPLSENRELIRMMTEARCPVVLIESTLDVSEVGSAVSKVGIDDYAAGLAMGEYFIARGHKRIGYISLRAAHNMANQRGEGLKSAMIAAGIDADNFLFASGESSFESGYAAAKTLLHLGHPPTAIFAGNDYMAAGVIAYANEIKLSVPEDLSVAGFDGADLSKMFVPPFMTVKQPLKDYGEWAAQKLLFAIKTHDDPGTIEQLDFKLIARGSVKALA